MAVNPYTMQAREERFAALIVAGYNQSDAYRAVVPSAAKLEPEQVWRSASVFAKRPMVVERCKALLNDAKLGDIEGVQHWFVHTLAMRERAEEAGNHNAAAQLNRQVGQANGALQDKLTISGPEQSDDALIAQLSKGDVTVAAMLAKMIGKDSFDA